MYCIQTLKQITTTTDITRNKSITKSYAQLHSSLISCKSTSVCFTIQLITFKQYVHGIDKLND